MAHEGDAAAAYAAEPAPAPLTESMEQLLLEEEYKRLLREIQTSKHTPKDWRDWSRDPSYSKFKIPFHIKCRDRYVENRKMYEEQFQHEIAQLLTQQSSAYEAARFQRHIAISTLWPPLHNRREIEYVQRHFFRLTRKQQSRYNYIMNTNII